MFIKLTDELDNSIMVNTNNITFMKKKYVMQVDNTYKEHAEVFFAGGPKDPIWVNESLQKIEDRIENEYIRLYTRYGQTR